MAKTETKAVMEAAPKPIPVEREAEFIERYANNVRYESTVYDLKLIFGQSDLGTGAELIRQHSAVTIPWALVKLMVYYLRTNVGVHELYNGKVLLPPQQIPFPFPPPTAEVAAADPKSQQAFVLVKELRDEFLSEISD